MVKIIDFHTHAFPDELAKHAMEKLKHQAEGIKAYSDGTVRSLLDSMDKCGIEKSVLCCIATKVSQFEPILAWCKKVQSDRIIPFPSIHPADPQAAERIAQIKDEGFKGIKMHPFYQDFYADEPRLFDIYDKVFENDLMLVLHTGFDIAFPPVERADPEKILKIAEAMPDFKLITTHLGSWRQWEKVNELLVGKKIYMEISFALELLEPEFARDIFMRHPAEYLLFGTDSPWTDQSQTVSLFKNLDLDDELERLILRENAERLLQ